MGIDFVVLRAKGYVFMKKTLSEEKWNELKKLLISLENSSDEDSDEDEDSDKESNRLEIFYDRYEEPMWIFLGLEENSKSLRDGDRCTIGASQYEKYQSNKAIELLEDFPSSAILIKEHNPDEWIKRRREILKEILGNYVDELFYGTWLLLFWN